MNSKMVKKKQSIQKMQKNDRYENDTIREAKTKIKKKYGESMRTIFFLNMFQA